MVLCLLVYSAVSCIEMSLDHLSLREISKNDRKGSESTASRDPSVYGTSPPPVCGSILVDTQMTRPPSKAQPTDARTRLPATNVPTNMQAAAVEADCFCYFAGQRSTTAQDPSARVTGLNKVRSNGVLLWLFFRAQPLALSRSTKSSQLFSPPFVCQEILEQRRKKMNAAEGVRELEDAVANEIVENELMHQYSAFIDVPFLPFSLWQRIPLLVFASRMLDNLHPPSPSPSPLASLQVCLLPPTH